MQDILDIGDRRELFVDDYLIDDTGGVTFEQHRPKPAGVALTNDRPWEAPTVGMFSVFDDKGRFRMYYRGAHGSHFGKQPPARGEPMCYAESRDGITWEKPELGLFAFEGSARNNIVHGGDRRLFPPTAKWRGDMGPYFGCHGDFVPFIDTRPGVGPEGRYKALIRQHKATCEMAGKTYGLYPYQSDDGLNWRVMSHDPAITRGRFDSQNLGFWDAVRNRYVAFNRDVHGPRIVDTPGRDFEDVPQVNLRDIRVSFSDDFIHWSDPEFLRYEDTHDWQLYTNAVMPYPRAPHLLIGFPTRYFPQENSQTEPILMISRDGGVTFRRWEMALVPRDAPSERDGNRGNYMACGLLPGKPGEMVSYATEGYHFIHGSHRLRRFVWRTDGFFSLCARGAGEFTTKPFVFAGHALELNYDAGANGSVRIEIRDAGGQQIPGYTLADSVELVGDTIGGIARWKVPAGAGVGRLAGQPIRLRFVLRDAALYSMRFASVHEKT